MKTFRYLYAVLFVCLRALFCPPKSWCKPDTRTTGDQIPTHFVVKYDQDLKLAYQQTKSRLEPFVTNVGAIVGASASFDFVQATESSLVTTRYQDVVPVNTPHARRWIDLADYDWDDYVDSFDKLKILSDPTNKYVQLAIAAHNRTKDRAIIAALFGTARETSGYGSTLTTSMTVLPPASKVAHNNANMTMAKLRSGIELLNIAEAGSPEEGGTRTFVYTANQLTKLMADVTPTSRDYNELKALNNYDINYFMGMNWVRTEQLPKTGNIRKCGIFAKEGMALGMGQNITNDITIRKDKRGYPIQVYSMVSLGAVRGQDGCVVEIECDESV